MYIEIKIALNFLLSYLYDKLPRRRVNLFGEELEKYLKQKLVLTNWSSTSSNSSSSGSSQNSAPLIVTNSLNESRCINLNKQDLQVDACLISAATDAAMDVKEILAQLPDYLKLFIEPGLVAYLLQPVENLNGAQVDLKILYKLPQIDESKLNYVNGVVNFGGIFKGINQLNRIFIRKI
jgi:hypothetical protein